jgi:hypothetical protein
MQETMNRLNGKSVDPIPESLLDIAEEQKVYIFNIYSREHRIDCVPGLGAVLIPACETGKPYSEAYIVPGIVFEHYDAGDCNLLFRQSPARSRKSRSGRIEPGVIDDILKPYAPRGMFSPNLVQWGVFAAAGPVPTKAELDQARKELFQTAKLFVADGDQKAIRGEKGEINFVNREMCLLLNQKKSWLEEEYKERDSCPACGGNITKGVAKCMHCSAILDHEKWAAFSGEEAKRGPGRPRKDESLA